MARSAAFAPADNTALEALRHSGDMTSQRRQVWKIIVSLTNTASPSVPLFQTWHGEDAVFATKGSDDFPRGLRGFSRTKDGPSTPSADVPALTYTLYNDAAYRHIRRYHLNDAAQLDRLRKAGAPDAEIAGDRSLPAFPTDAIILKTVWWPVSQKGLTALPVWDPRQNPPNRAGNPYTSWQRIVAVDPSEHVRAGSVAMDFAGTVFPKTHHISLAAFDHIVLDADLARRMMRDPQARKAAAIALGRRLRAGDYLVLVAANLATREIPDWIWATFWWHDQAGDGAFAAGRPDALQSPWRNYLMQTAFDSQEPAANDGGPHICFDPWLEGRFPDGGHGGGTVSNCLGCHQRASYPPVSFLPVTRGPPDVRNDPAFAPGRLRTSFLWSLALHARP